MTTFTTVPTFVVGQVVSASDINTYLRDDINYLIADIEPSLTNGSTGTQSAGTLVSISTAAVSKFSVPATAGAIGTMGVLMENNITTSSAGRIAVTGFHTVLTTGTVALGDYLIPSATTGYAQSNGVIRTNAAFAQAVTTSASTAGSVTAQVFGAGPQGFGFNSHQSFFWGNDAVAGTAVEVLTTGTVTKAVSVLSNVCSTDSAVFQGGAVNTLLGANSDILSAGGATNVVQIQVSAGGRVTVVRTAGTKTYHVGLLLMWR